MSDIIRPNGQNSFNRRVLYLFFLYALILLDRFSRDGGRGLCRVVLLNIRGGGGDGPPCLTAATGEGDTTDHQ